MIWQGASVNLTRPRVFGVRFPVPPLFDAPSGRVMELVFWSDFAQRWVHVVSQQFQRAQPLPQGAVQIALTDMQWVRQHVRQGGLEGLAWAVRQIEAYQRGRA